MEKVRGGAMPKIDVEKNPHAKGRPRWLESVMEACWETEPTERMEMEGIVSMFDNMYRKRNKGKYKTKTLRDQSSFSSS